VGRPSIILEHVSRQGSPSALLRSFALMTAPLVTPVGCERTSACMRPSRYARQRLVTPSGEHQHESGIRAENRGLVFPLQYVVSEKDASQRGRLHIHCTARHVQ